MKKTGWPAPLLMQDDNPQLSRWFASRPDALYVFKRNNMTHNHDLEINTNTEPDNNPVHEAVLFFWGERCPEHEDGCPTCEAWKQYDSMIQGGVK